MPRRPPATTGPAAADVPLELLQSPPGELGEQDRWVGVRATAGTPVAAQAHDVELRESLLHGVDLAGRDLRGLRARDVRFAGCDLSGAVLDSASLLRVEFVDCRMTGVMITNAELRDVVLRECRADLTNWRLSVATHLLAASTSLREADFYDSRLTDCALVECDLREATFRDCRLSDVDLHGSRLEDLRDAGGLGGASISPDQVIPLAFALLAAQGVGVTEHPRWQDFPRPG